MKYLLIASVLFFTSAGCQSNGANGETEAKTVSEEKAVSQTEKTPIWETWNDIGDLYGEMTITINAPQPQLKNKKIYLYETEGKESYKLDSTQVKDGIIRFQGEYGIGLYKVGMDENNAADLILNPNEKELKAQLGNPRFSYGLNVSGSTDNAAWRAYQNSEKQFQSQLRSLKQQRARSQDKASFESRIYAKDDERIASHMALADQYPGTFSAKILHRLRSPNHRNKSKFWDDIDFNDLSYIRSPLINDRITDFMRNHSGGQEDGFLNCVDLLMLKAKENEKSFEYCLYTVLEGFYSTGMDNICNYILNDYYFGDACGDIELSDYSLVKASRIKNLQVGNTPPDFSINTLERKKYTLSKDVGKNNYTLVFFWSSWCHTCEGEIPQLINIYEQFNDKGFEIIGVSVDTDRNAWANAVNSRNLKWPNVSQLQGWDSPVAKDYRVSKTPNMFILDKDMKIQLKPKNANQVRQFLSANIQ